MRYKIVIPKKGKNVGVAMVEGLEKNENCRQVLEEVAVSLGGVQSVQPKEHFDDDNPVFDNVNVNDQ